MSKLLRYIRQKLFKRKKDNDKFQLRDWNEVLAEQKTIEKKHRASEALDTKLDEETAVDEETAKYVEEVVEKNTASEKNAEVDNKFQLRDWNEVLDMQEMFERNRAAEVLDKDAAVVEETAEYVEEVLERNPAEEIDNEFQLRDWNDVLAEQKTVENDRAADAFDKKLDKKTAVDEEGIRNVKFEKFPLKIRDYVIIGQAVLDIKKNRAVKNDFNFMGISSAHYKRMMRDFQKGEREKRNKSSFF